MDVQDKLERELRRIGAWDAGQGGVTLREEAPGIVTVLDESAGSTVHVGTGVVEALAQVASGTGYEDVWAALRPYQLKEPAECELCHKYYEYEDGVDAEDALRLGPCCSSPKGAAAS